MLEGALGICQTYPDNPFAVDDLKYAKEAARVLAAEDFGEDQEFIINKDPENQNITKLAYTSVFTNGSIVKRLKEDPELRHLGFIFVSCRGMHHKGKQDILLNEFEGGPPENGFYRFMHIE